MSFFEKALGIGNGLIRSFLPSPRPGETDQYRVGRQEDRKYSASLAGPSRPIQLLAKAREKLGDKEILHESIDYQCR